jgi:phosphoglycerate kinase
MQSIADYSFKGKKALIRVDFNVPLSEQYALTDTGRIDKSLPTIQKVLADGGAAILLTHLGRPQGRYDKALSLQQLVPYLTKKLGTPVTLVPDCIGPTTVEKAHNLASGTVLLLENVRFHPEEENNDPAFGKALASLGDVYINDAFGAIHRRHASTYQVPLHMAHKMRGYLLQAEIDSANRLLKGYQKPFTIILGGTKVADKLPAIETLLDKVDHLLIGGGVANTFQQALGGQVGNSVVAPTQLEVALNIFHIALERGLNIILPTDVMVADQFNQQAQKNIASGQAVPEGWMAVDIGPHTQSLFKEVIQQSATILWIGSIGAFEIPAFSEGTRNTLASVSQATQEGAFSLVGGGDSAKALSQWGYTDKVSFVSTGGGALLGYLAQQHLPCLEVLEARQV